MLVIACQNCTYGALQKSSDPDGIELKLLQDIHRRTFKHDIVLRQANAEDVIKYHKEKK